MARPVDDPGPEVGFTGARFGAAARRPRSASPGPAPPDPGTGAPPAPDPASPVGRTGARFGGASRRRATAPVPPVPPAPSRPVPPPVPPPVPVDPGPTDGASRSPGVRPYVLTGGRTRPTVGFAVEALVTSTPGPGPEDGPPEHARIRELCRAPRSVAEVAALLGAPLGVVRVLLADLFAAGGVTVHRTADAGGPDDALLERVLAGLRRL